MHQLCISQNKHLQHAAEAEHQRPVLRADVEVGESCLELVPCRWLRGRGGGQGVTLLRQHAVGWMPSCAGAQAPVA